MGASSASAGAALCSLDRLLERGCAASPVSSCGAGAAQSLATALGLPPSELPARRVGLSRGRSRTGSQNVANGPRASKSALSAGNRHVLRVLGGASVRGSDSDL